MNHTAITVVLSMACATAALAQGTPALDITRRSLATVSVLIAMNRPYQLRSHLALALNNAVTREELIETITHLAFYTGWPSAVTAIGVAKEVLPQR